MGLFFKKSKNFGGLRFNFSKSGLGVSLGFKGLRLSSGPRGLYLNASKNGLYYREKLKNEEADVIVDQKQIIERVPVKTIDIPKELNNFCIFFTFAKLCIFVGAILLLFLKPFPGLLLVFLGIISNFVLIKKNPEKYKSFKEWMRLYNEARRKYN